MASQYGPIFTEDKIKSILKEQNKTYEGDSFWNKATDSAMTQFEKGYEVQDKAYRDALSSAYSAYEKNKRTIENYDILGRNKESLLASQQSALEDAYSTARNLYGTNVSSLYNTLNQDLTAIDKELTTKAANTTSYFNMFEDYYGYLIENYGDSLGEEDKYKNIFWNEEQERWLDWKEILQKSFDESESLTDYGTGIFDFLENYEATPKERNEELSAQLQGLQSFNEFLAEQNPELYKWAFEADPYNYTKGGRNINSLKELTGRKSDDYEFNAIENLGVLNLKELKSAIEEGDIDKMYNVANKYEISSYFDNVSKDITGMNYSEFVKYYNDVKDDTESKNVLGKGTVENTAKRKEEWTKNLKKKYGDDIEIEFKSKPGSGATISEIIVHISV